jgi:heptosyltransferase-2
MRPVHHPSERDPRSILVALPTWVGDFVMATPTLRAIRTRFANARITFLIEPNLVELARGGEWMDELIEWPGKDRRSPLHKEYRRIVAQLRHRRFDWALLLSNSFRSALVVRLAGIKRRIGYDRDGRGLLLTDRLPVKNRRERVEPCSPRLKTSGTQHSSFILPPSSLTHTPPGRFTPMPLVEYLADLAEAIGCDRPGHRLELFTMPDCDASVEERLASLGIAGHRPLVVIAPGAKYGAAKCWPVERFAAVADRLIESEKAAVVIACGPGEEPLARQLGSAMAGKSFVFDSPRLTLGEQKSLVKRSDLLLCNDTGPRHLAKAFDVPVVTIFGPTHPEWTATHYDAERIVRIDVDCGPCQRRVCPLGHFKCMTGVTVETVFEATRELLSTRLAHAKG